MTKQPRIIYPPHHRNSARSKQERRDKLEAMVTAGVILALMAIILQFTL